MSAVAAWDTLHSKARHRLEYPSEHVVRFLAQVEREPDDRRHATAVDIGCGSGRHAIVLNDFGYLTSACDSSAVACATARKLWGVAARFVQQASMTALPYADGEFDVALAYGVFYYGTRDTHRQAVAELHRVLRPGGQAFVCVRTNRDWRHQHPDALKGEPEHGMALDFLSLPDIPDVYAAFTLAELERSETTTDGMERVNSDWLITLTR